MCSGAAGQTEAALEPGYPGFDSGTKLAELFVNILAAAHIGFFQAAFLGKAHVLDFTFFGLGEIVLGSKTTVQSDLQWIAAVYLMLTIEHRFNQFAIGGVAFKDNTIQDQVGGPARQTDLMTVVCVSAILDDDVRMIFENENTFWPAGTLSP